MNKDKDHNPPAGPLGLIEAHCRAYERESAELETMIADLEADLGGVKRRHLQALRGQAALVAGREAQIIDAVAAAPGLFQKPRTLILHGVKIGFARAEGRIAWDDDDLLARRIRKILPALESELIRTRDDFNKEALRRLDADQRKSLGVRIEGEGDDVVVRRMAGELKKLFDAMVAKLVAQAVSGEPS